MRFRDTRLFLHRHRYVSFWATLVLVVVPAFTVAGCAYEAGYYRRAEAGRTIKSSPAEPQIIRGRKSLILDGLGHYVLSLPTKLFLWNWSIDNHDISEENEEILGRYLRVNALDTTQVRLNSYAPHKEFSRLSRNQDVHGGYKYTLGAISVLFYTLIPDRLFAGLISGDHYNPYTNTIHIYSDHPAILVHEGGHAKDFAGRSMRGSYALARILPGVDLHQEYRASSDAIDYFYCRQEETNELNAYPILMPAYATYVGKYLGPGIDLIGVVYAHFYGRYYRGLRRDELATAQKEMDMDRGTCGESGDVEDASPPGGPDPVGAIRPSSRPARE